MLWPILLAVYAIGFCIAFYSFIRFEREHIRDLEDTLLHGLMASLVGVGWPLVLVVVLIIWRK